jgi:proline iminopeptidase
LSEYLDTLVAELAGLVTTARYQQRGLAPSAVSGDTTVDGHVADAVAVMDTLGWEKPLVIGHSWGGHLALHLAVAYQDRVGGLVILDSLGAVGDGGIAEFGLALQAGLSSEALARIAELDAKESPTEDERREHLTILWPNYFGDPMSAPPMPELRFGSGSTWNSIVAHFEAATLERGLPTVTVPTLVIHGGRSPMPLEQAQHTVRLLPNATLTVHHGKGHWAWLEEPGFVRTQVESFLADL